MKILHLFAIAALLLTCGGIQCRPTYEQSGLIGKLVINGACDNFAVEVIGGHIDPRKVTTAWKDPVSGNTYLNVFSVTDRCAFSQYGIKPGGLFRFSLADSSMGPDCPVCEIFVALPPVYNTVTDVRPLQ